MPQLINNQQTQSQIDSQRAALAALLNGSNSPSNGYNNSATYNNSNATTNIGTPNTLQQPTYSQQNPPPMSKNIDPYQVVGNDLAIKSATDVLKDHYDQHAQALAQSPEGIAVLNQLVNMHKSQQDQQSQTNQDNNTLQPLTGDALNQNTQNSWQQQASNILNQKPGIMGSIFPGIQQDRISAQLTNLAGAQKIGGNEPLQQADYQKNLLPLTAYEKAQVGVQRSQMLLNYGGQVSKDFQDTIKPDMDAVNDGLMVKKLYDNFLQNPNNQQAQQEFINASAQYQGIKDPKDLLKGRSVASAGFGALNQLIGGGGGLQTKELYQIQKANESKFAVSQKKIEAMTNQHQDRLRRLGLDPDQFINKFNQNGDPQEGSTATNPQTGDKITYRGGKWQ